MSQRDKSIYLGLLLCVIGQFAHAQTTTITNYIFGHSLLDHRPPAIPTPSNETTVPHWLYLLAQSADKEYSVAGQYGFLPQHADLPPFSQWGYDLVPPAWESDFEPFSEADFTTIILTAGNFMQWQGPDQVYPGGDGVTSPISATETIVDWVRQEEDTLTVYIYENWPDMAPYLTAGNFPPSAQELANYNDYTRGEFHDWWIEYQDALLLSRPTAQIRMIPVGPIIANLLSATPLNGIPLEELYEDDAPHGRPSLYFLASLITYMAIYAEEAPAGFTVPAIVHEVIRDNYEAVSAEIWAALLDFNDESGTSRVFFDDPISSVNSNGGAEKNWLLYPNPGTGLISLEIPTGESGPLSLELIDSQGRSLWQQTVQAAQESLDIHRRANWADGIYTLKITTAQHQEVSKRVVFQ